MGQTNSRHRNEQSSISPPQSQPLNDTIPTDEQSRPSLPSVTPKRSSRLPFRRSILNVIKPKTGGSSQTNCENGGTKSRRLWRSSRRWSRARSQVVEDPGRMDSSHVDNVSTLPEKFVEPDSQHAESSLLGVPDQESAVSPLTESTSAEPPPPVIAISNNDESTTNPGTHSNDSPTQLERADVAVEVTESSELPELTSDEAASRLDTLPAASDVSLPTQPLTLSDPSSASRTHARQFPPPGTLVVVQGVVHTSDIPSRSPGSTASSGTPQPPTSTGQGLGESNGHNSSDTGSRPSTPSGGERTRSRLSSLLRPRPVSSVYSRPPSIRGDNGGTVNDSTASSSLPPSTDDTVHALPPSIDSSSSTVPVGDAQTQAADTALTNGHPSMISSSSIDVLGTLLSVAAAATAASLLTGSPEPMMNNGLSPPSINNAASSPPVPLFPRSSSSTSASGVAESNPLSSDANRNERVRSVWGSFRERFGLRSSPGTPSGGENGRHGIDDARSRAEATTIDPREMMLAEMARAFNAGLGLNESGDGAENADTRTTSPQPPLADNNPRTPSSLQLPPEGSFERFLVDLQIDLRMALTQRPDSYSGDSQENAGDLAADVPAPAHPAESIQNEVPSVAANLPGPSSPHTHLVDGNDLPPFVDVSDSSDPEDDEEISNDSIDDNGSNHAFRGAENDVRRMEDVFEPRESTFSDDSQPSPGSDQEHPSNMFGSQPSQHGIPGRINWWRFYRFPAIPAPRTQVLAGALRHTTASATAPPPSTNPQPSPTDPLSYEAQIAPLPSAETPSAVPQMASPREPSPSMVIPVIVVGLQSVNTPVPWHHEATTEMPPQGQMESAEESGQSNSPGDPFPFDTQEPDTTNVSSDSAGAHDRNSRGRSWHSRAANAIRNLRTGRRSLSPHNRLPIDSVGSRTFLIYVIGGYYPPDHSIVTQTFNNFESFEALLELAELLGQVKPPTVTKEEIDKSGLEVIGSSQLAGFEREGKVSSNCIDRCLVCLDDYLPDDSIRIMSCKHAFHRDCVDRWLQTGRNNCPACRSKGVSTEEHNPPSTL